MKEIFLNRYRNGIRDFQGIDLSGMYLSDISLIGVNLSKANLQNASFENTDLQRANLHKADFTNASICWANFMDANLSCAKLNGADFTGANFARAVLKNVEHDLVVPIVENIHQKMYEATLKHKALNMHRWHSCDTTHCRAGWVIVLAGDEGSKLARAIGTDAAAALIYQASDPELDRVPDWFSSEKEALADIAKIANKGCYKL